MSSDAFGRPPEVPQPPAPGGARPGERPMSGLAIATLVTGIFGLVLVTVVLGIIALRRIASRGQRGRGLAIAGLVLAALWTLFIVAAVVISAATDAERDDEGRVAVGGSLSVFELRRGDCLNGVEEAARVMSVDSVPCEGPHEAQVYVNFTIPGDEFPGTERVNALADRGCQQRVADNAPSIAEDESVGLFFFNPTEQSWDTQDDRTVICLALFPEPRRGSVVP